MHEHDAAESRSAEALLRSQWQRLRAWITSAGVLDHAEDPTGLGEWTVHDLVAHLGLALSMIAEVRPAVNVEPLPIARYVAGYAPARQEIADATTELSGSLSGDLVSGVDRLVDDAWQAISTGLPEVVLGRRGPLTRDDYLLTRLLELVVHGDDLHRALGRPVDSPLDAPAVTAIADTLATAYLQRTGHSPSAEGLELIREATGRAPSEDANMPLLS